jgi:hypothetical protein
VRIPVTELIWDEKYFDGKKVALFVLLCRSRPLRRSMKALKIVSTDLICLPLAESLNGGID